MVEADAVEVDGVEAAEVEVKEATPEVVVEEKTEE
jgi:hypothetical protein